jgi:hypothetical protein
MRSHDRTVVEYLVEFLLGSAQLFLGPFAVADVRKSSANMLSHRGKFHVVPAAQFHIIAFDVNGSTGLYYGIMVLIPFRVYMTDELAGSSAHYRLSLVTSEALKPRFTDG